MLQEVLEFNFDKAAITAAAQAMGACQFAHGSFDGIALVHAFFELRTVLLVSPLLLGHDRRMKLPPVEGWFLASFSGIVSAT